MVTILVLILLYNTNIFSITEDVKRILGVEECEVSPTVILIKHDFPKIFKALYYKGIIILGFPIRISILRHEIAHEVIEKCLKVKKRWLAEGLALRAAGIKIFPCGIINYNISENELEKYFKRIGKLTLCQRQDIYYISLLRSFKYKLKLTSP